MRKLIVLFLLFVRISACCAQQADSLVLNYFSTDRWQDLRRLYEQKSDSMSKESKELSIAMLHTAFDTPTSALKPLKKLLKHSVEVDADTRAYLAFSQADCLHRMKENHKAAKLLKQYLSKNRSEISEKVILNYTEMANFYEDQANEGEVTLEATDIPKISFLLEDVGFDEYRSKVVIVNGSIDGKSVRFLIDSGSSNNVLSRELVDKLHLPISANSISIEGSGTSSSKYTFAKEVKLGNIHLNHLPFIISDLEQSSVDKHSNIAQFDAIIGLQLFQLLGKTIFDFDKKVITTDYQDDGTSIPNLSYSNTHNMIFLEYEHKGYKLSAIPDMGAQTSILGDSYRRNIPKSSLAKELELSYIGYGSEVKETKALQLPYFELEVSGVRSKIPRVLAYQEERFQDLLGMDYFSRFHKVIFNLRKMTLRVVP